MTETHYTPEIDEFYVGFECEKLFFNDHPTFKGERIWYDKHIVDQYDFEDLEEDLQNNHFRVKYLDRADIESLGWIEFDPGSGKYKDIYENWELLTDGTTISLYKDGDARFVDGTIRNKSELKKLMKQLGI